MDPKKVARVTPFSGAGVYSKRCERRPPHPRSLVHDQGVVAAAFQVHRVRRDMDLEADINFGPPYEKLVRPSRIRLLPSDVCEWETLDRKTGARLVTSDVVIFWVIYRPEPVCPYFVVRRQFFKMRPEDEVSKEIAPSGTFNAGEPQLDLDTAASYCDTLDDARERLPPGLTNITRPNEHESIVEVWI